jgi:hypothetical protein
MQPPQQYINRDVQFHPPEAFRLADKIVKKIRHGNAEQTKIDSSVNYLDFHWEECRKECFISKANLHLKKIAMEIKYDINQKMTPFINSGIRIVNILSVKRKQVTILFENHSSSSQKDHDNMPQGRINI